MCNPFIIKRQREKELYTITVKELWEVKWVRGKIGPLLALYFHGFEFPNVLSIEFPIFTIYREKVGNGFEWSFALRKRGGEEKWAWEQVSM